MEGRQLGKQELHKLAISVRTGAERPCSRVRPSRGPRGACPLPLTKPEGGSGRPVSSRLCCSCAPRKGRVSPTRHLHKRATDPGDDRGLEQRPPGTGSPQPLLQPSIPGASGGDCSLGLGKGCPMGCEVPSSPLFLLSAKVEELLWVLGKGRPAFSLTSNCPLSDARPNCLPPVLTCVGSLGPVPREHSWEGRELSVACALRGQHGGGRLRQGPFPPLASCSDCLTVTGKSETWNGNSTFFLPTDSEAPLRVRPAASLMGEQGQRKRK